uniref:Uncharacterized protein n=1 Tax=viral metagenome TaxID=1070528 RepID=A0A6C0IAI6_9ZZZZ
MNINLTEFITDDVNIIEIFLCNDSKDNDSDENRSEIDVNITSDFESFIEKKYKKYKEERYKSYHHKDKVYTYELSSDNQYVSSKITMKSELIKNNNANAKSNLFILSSKIDKFPQYIFPCTNDIDNITMYLIKEFKINNRISLMLRYDYLNGCEDKVVSKSFNIEYRHSPNVEIDKINEYVNNLVAAHVAYA